MSVRTFLYPSVALQCCMNRAFQFLCFLMVGILVALLTGETLPLSGLADF